MLAVHTRNMNYYVNDKFYYLILKLKQIIYLIQKYIKSYFATLRSISFSKFKETNLFIYRYNNNMSNKFNLFFKKPITYRIIFESIHF